MHGTRRTPVFGLVVSSLLVTGLVFMNYNASLVDQFTQVLLLATLTTLVPYAYSAAAQVVMFFRDPELFSGSRFARDTVIATLALRVLRLGDLGRRRGDDREGLHASDRRHPGVHLAEVAPEPRSTPPDWEVPLQRTPPPRKRPVERVPVGMR